MTAGGSSYVYLVSGLRLAQTSSSLPRQGLTEYHPQLVREDYVVGRLLDVRCLKV